MITLIPMAGAGSRFAENGYKTPKPLLPLFGLPMVVSACNALPKSDRQVFIARDFHVSEYGIDKQLRTYLPHAEVITIDALTEGQASTCLLAKDIINTDEELVIGASDNGLIYAAEDFNRIKQTCDAIVFTFRNNPAVLAKPTAYGWVETADDNRITQIKVKYNMPDPMQSHAVTGAFWFKRGRDFVAAAERMISQNRRINNEFYVDECINDILALGLTAKVFEVQHYVCWGTPADYETFNYWEDFFSRMSFHPYKKPAVVKSS